MLLLDAILELKPVQYLLLFIIAALLLATGYSAIQQKALSLQLSAAKGDNARYAAQLLTQNAAITRQGQDMENLLKKLQQANEAVKTHQQQLKKRQEELGRLILSGTCEEQVQQVFQEVRK